MSNLTFSNSKINTYNTCARKYYYQYLSHYQPDRDETDTSALDLGSLVHLCLETTLRGGDPYEVALAASEYDQSIRDKAIAMLDAYLPHLELGTDNKPYIYNDQPALELAFNVPLYDIYINGLIDAILVTNDGRNILVDWKCRKYLYSDEHVRIDRQLYLYVHAANVMGIPIDGAVQVQLSTIPPAKPKFNKDGSLSKVMGKTTEEALRYIGGLDMLGFMGKIEPIDSFIRFTHIDISKTNMDRFMNSTMASIRAIQSDALFRRVYNSYTCKGCPFLTHCANA